LKTGPGDSARSHMADEYIFPVEILEGIEGYIALLEPILGTHPSLKDYL
jgi:acetylornithine deacetylase